MAALERSSPAPTVQAQAAAPENPAPINNLFSGLDSPATAGGAPSGGALMTIEEMERQLIGQALNETDGNRTHAARILGISVRTLRNKLAEYRVAS